MKKSDSNLDVEPASQASKTFKCDQCILDFKTENGSKIHVGKSHKDKIPQVAGRMYDITAEAAVQTSKVTKQESKESSTLTDSPFECGDYCGEIFDDKHSWKMHLLKVHLDVIKIMCKRHSRFLHEAVKYKSSVSQTWDKDILRFMDIYKDLKS